MLTVGSPQQEAETSRLSNKSSEFKSRVGRLLILHLKMPVAKKVTASQSLHSAITLSNVKPIELKLKDTSTVAHLKPASPNYLPTPGPRARAVIQASLCVVLADWLDPSPTAASQTGLGQPPVVSDGGDAPLVPPRRCPHGRQWRRPSSQPSRHHAPALLVTA